MANKQLAASEERNESRIFFIRGQKVMLGMHLAETYGVEPQTLNQAVERNIECFPKDAVFQLNPEEIANLKSQHAISIQAAPYVFTGQGVAMLSSILLDENSIYGNKEICAPTCSCRKS